jgi:U3 small nucleolar RNA-associated protein 15
MTMSHGAPVEALLMNAAGTLLVSAGLNMVKVWDVVGGKVLHSVSMHNKTVTCLAFGRSGTRLLTGSLDQQIKVHDLATMDVVHTMRFDEPILAMGVSKQSTHLAVGHPSGNLVIRALSAKAAAAAEGAPAEASARGGTAGAPAAVRFIDRSAVSAPSGLEAADQAISRATTASASAARREDDLNVESKRRVRLQAYDRFLRKFQFHAALDASLATKDPVVVCSMLDELTQRRVVHSALQGRNEESLLPILIFLNRYIVNPRYSTLLFKITNSVLDLYESEIGSSPAVDEQIVKLHQRIYSEVLLQRQLQSLQGSLDMIMAGASF